MFCLKFLNFVYLSRESINLGKKEKISLKCFAPGANPEPQFNWYIGDTNISSLGVQDAACQDDRNKCMSMLNYTSDSKDFAKMLKCEVIHPGYDDERQEIKVQLMMRWYQ